MTTALEGGEGLASLPGRSLPPGKTRYPLYRRLGGPQGRSGQMRKMPCRSDRHPLIAVCLEINVIRNCKATHFMRNVNIKVPRIRSSGLIHYMSLRAKDWGVRLTTHLPLVPRLRMRTAVTSRVKDKSALNSLVPRVRDRHVISAERGRASSLTSKSRPETL
jgi:hypothetical protein